MGAPRENDFVLESRLALLAHFVAKPHVARVLPAEAGAVSANGDGARTPADNHRRCDLIDKKYQSGLTPTEEMELATLTTGLRKFMDRVAPVSLDDVRRLHQGLLEKAAQAKSNSGA